MADPSYRALVPGHIGDGSYNYDESLWTYSVETSNITSQVLNSPQSTTNGDESASHEQHTSFSIPKPIARLLGGYPEFIGGFSAISQSLKTPIPRPFYHLQDGKHSYIGRLLATARYSRSKSQQRKHDKNAQLFVAFTGGTNGEVLRLVPSLPESHIHSINNGRLAQTNSFSYKDAVSWAGHGESIQQICFSRREKKLAPILAVRYPSSIEVFHPKMRRRPITDRSLDQKASTQLGHLDLNHVISIPAVLAGDAPFVDMMFNPRKLGSLTSVNALGQWHIWDLDISKRTFNLLHHDRIDAAVYHIRSGISSNHNDGWHKVLWVGNDWIVAVCTRSGVEVSDVRSGSRVFHKFDWAEEYHCKTLDVMLRPSYIDELIFITSSKVYWLKITQIDAPGVLDISSSKMETILFWIHYRDRQDATLQLSYRSNNGGFSLFTFSRHTPHIEEYRIWHGIPSGNRYPQDVVSPVLVHPFPRLLPIGNTTGLSDLQFWNHPVQSAVMDVVDTVVQCIYLVQGSWLREVFFVEAPIAEPGRLSQSATKHSLGPRPGIRKTVKSRRMAIQDFIIPDDVYESETDDGIIQHHFKENNTDGVSFNHNNDPSVQNDTLRARRSVDMFDFYKQASKLRQRDETALEQSLQMLSRALRGINSDQLTPLKPLLAIWPQNRPIGDVSELSDALQALISSHTSAPDLRFHSVPSTFNSLSIGDETSLFLIYRSLRQKWLTSLSYSTPPRVRLDKDNHLRHIAVELYLSSWCISFIKQAVQQPKLDLVIEDSSKAKHLTITSQNVDRLGDTRYFPLHKVQESGDTARYGSSEVLGYVGTPESTTTPVAQSALSRLQHYAKIGKIDYSPNLDTNRVLSHWTIGANPFAYDYQATATTSAKAGRRVREATSSSIQSRLKRRAERQLSKPSNPDKRHKMDPRITSSQPAAGQSLFLSSQLSPQSQFDNQLASTQDKQVDVTASQVQSGRYGGRYSKKREAVKQPKRKRGF